MGPESPEFLVQPAWELERTQAVEENAYYQNQIGFDYPHDILQRHRDDEVKIFNVPITACFMEFRDIVQSPTLKPRRLLQLQYVLLNKIVDYEYASKQPSSTPVEKDVYRRLINLSKMIGDSMYAYVVDYDRSVLRWTAQRPGTGFISGGHFQPELEAASKVVSEGKIAILNDLTNFGRFADVTTASEDEDMFREVKAGRASRSDRRASSQRQEMEETRGFIRDNIVKNIEKGEISQRYIIDAPITHYRQNVFHHLVDKAQQEGYASYVADDNQIMQIEVFDSELLKTQGKDLNEVKNDAHLIGRKSSRVSYDSYGHAFFEPLMMTIPVTSWKGLDNTTLWRIATGKIQYRTTVDFNAYRNRMNRESALHGMEFVLPEDFLQISDLRAKDKISSLRKLSDAARFIVRLADEENIDEAGVIHKVSIGHYGPMLVEMMTPSTSMLIDFLIAQQNLKGNKAIKLAIEEVKEERQQRSLPEVDVQYRGYVAYPQDRQNWV